MTYDLTNKVAVVTGGNSGIGLGIAQELAERGAKVFVTGRRQEELDAAVKLIGHGAVGVQGDVTSFADLDHLYDVVQQHGAPIDILVANAGGGAFQPLGEITEEEFDRTFGLNVKATLFTVQKALPLLRDGASIILTGSTTSTRSEPAFSVYGATKAAIRNFARSWILDLRDRKIRVNVIAPGATTTPGLKGLASTDEQWNALEGEFAARVPLGRLADPREIGKVAAFLASDAASYVNGVELFVDGGFAQI
ncbi:SDR family oxidoreductase [Sphingopyxis sp. DHUNG17]|uniref:SDR family NAD(P)-dependent oxidoreductase n=1 Tax=Sphingopyxis jiangsuensis TaxID=2871171 RepID=UPI00191CC5E7|nr:SDR family oxidoreductase [Sphingopyxis lutea]MBL0768690.1 SDR family oxidoreductase [Sphingopyxis lutea]